jgi:hypothetical protein
MLDFGKVGLGGTKSLPLTIHNKGAYSLKIESFVTDAPFIGPTTTPTLAPGASVMVDVRFLPTALGDQAGQLSIATSDPKAKSVVVPLSGTGIQASVTVDPAMLDFGDVLFNAATQPMSLMVKVTNPGTDSFMLTSLQLTDSGSGAFTLDPGMAQKAYGPGESNTFSVSFLPKAMGLVTGAVHIQTTAPNGADITVPLRGKAVGPVMQICANLDGMPETCTTNGGHPILHFVVDHAMTGGGQIRVLNTGDRDLTIAQTLVTGNAPSFMFTPSAPSMSTTVIMPGQDSKWQVTFAPPAYAFESFILSFVSDAQPPTGSLRIDGRVKQPTIRVCPTMVTMSVAGNPNPMMVPVSIYSCGDTPVVLGMISSMQTGGPVPALSIDSAPNPGTSITPQSCATDPCTSGMASPATFNIDFAGSTNGTYMSTVVVPSNDPTSPMVTITVKATKS